MIWKTLLLLIVGGASTFAAGRFMYLHNQKLDEAIMLSIAVALGYLFLWILDKL